MHVAREKCVVSPFNFLHYLQLYLIKSKYYQMLEADWPSTNWFHWQNKIKMRYIFFGKYKCFNNELERPCINEDPTRMLVEHGYYLQGYFSEVLACSESLTATFQLIQQTMLGLLIDLFLQPIRFGAQKQDNWIQCRNSFIGYDTASAQSYLIQTLPSDRFESIL